jgi:hypothetical protein
MEAAALEARTALENRLVEAEGVHHQALQRATAALAEAAARHADIEARLGEEASARAALERRLADSESAGRSAEHRHAAELDSLTGRLAAAQAEVAAAASQNGALERLLHESGAALEQARADWRTEIAGLSERLQQREIEAVALGAGALAARTALETRLADAEAVHRQMQQRLEADLADALARRAAVESRLNEEAEMRATLERRLAATESAGRDAEQQHASALAALTARLVGLEAQHQAAIGEQAAAEQRFAEAAASLEHARAGWQSDISTAAARQAALEEQAEAGRRDLARLQRDADDLGRQLNAMRTRAAALRRHAQRVSALERHLDESHKENRRQFERAPYGLCECTREGLVTRVNHSLGMMLGYRSTDLHRMDIAAEIFESVADLHWLLERALQTGKMETVETTLKTLDRRHLFVRLHAATADGPVMIAVEDLTRLRAVERRLRDAQRMEAVGRVASEVAVTCDTLLQDVSHGGRQWLAVFESDTLLRQQGELLLGDVSRAAGFLRQFAIYGHQQIGNVEPVSLPRLLRDMAPVLKRVLGDDITLLLPKTTDRFEVDVDAERVERILVNVANYARERMPNGGRVSLQLATAMVDRKFLASHPRVRPGAHVLITITEIQGAVWPALPVQLPISRGEHPDAPRAASDRPGMDLGPLVALIGESGGHLWMSAEPAGNTTLQIHLPKRVHDEIVEPDATASRSDRGRPLTRWFRH